MILGVSMIAVGEAFVLGERLGLTHQALFDVASAASGQCWALTTNCPVPGPVPTSPANRDYQPGFAGALMAKDLGLAPNAIRPPASTPGWARSRAKSTIPLRGRRCGPGLLGDHHRHPRRVGAGNSESGTSGTSAGPKPRQQTNQTQNQQGEHP